MAARLVYLSPVNWDSFAQRPHQFVRWWHQATGGEVLWLDPYPSRLPHWNDVHRLRQSPQACGAPCPDWMQRIRPPAWPVEPLPGAPVLQRLLWRPLLARVHRFVSPGDAELVVGKPSRLALQVACGGTFAHRCYDAMDDFPAFHGGRAAAVMDRLERALLGRVDCVTASSDPLVTKFAPRHANVIAVLNGFDPHSMAGVSSTRAPTGRPVMGYVGTIREWFDWPLLIRLAQAVPEAIVRLIGPMDSPPPLRLPSNVECLPACPHAVAMQHMGQFTAGLIPFRLNRLTAGVDPIKYYEYAALGIPVLSTPFGQMRYRSRSQGVFGLGNGTDLVEAVKAALAWRPAAAELCRFRQQNSWTSRFSSGWPTVEGAFTGPAPGLTQETAVLPENG